MVQPATQNIIDALAGIVKAMAAIEVKLKAFVPDTFKDICAMVELHDMAFDLETQVSDAATKISSTSRLNTPESLLLVDPVAKLSAGTLAFLLTVGAVRVQFSKAILGALPATPFIKGHLSRLQGLFDSMMQQIVNVVDPLSNLAFGTTKVAISTAFSAQTTVTYMTDLGIYIPFKIPRVKSSSAGTGSK